MQISHCLLGLVCIYLFFVFKTTCIMGIGFLKFFFLICPWDRFLYLIPLVMGRNFLKFVLVFLSSLHLFFKPVDKRREILKPFLFVFVYVFVSNHLLEEESFWSGASYLSTNQKARGVPAIPGPLKQTHQILYVTYLKEAIICHDSCFHIFSNRPPMEHVLTLLGILVPENA